MSCARRRLVWKKSFYSSPASKRRKNRARKLHRQRKPRNDKCLGNLPQVTAQFLAANYPDICHYEVSFDGEASAPGVAAAWSPVSCKKISSRLTASVRSSFRFQ